MSEPATDRADPDLNVLISSAGRRVALMDAFRGALGRLDLPGAVLAADASRLSAGFHHADRAYQVPRCLAPEFVPFMLDLCRRERVRLLVPTLDTELPVYAAHRAEFEALGTTVAISSPDTIRIGADKVATHQWLVAAGLPTVRQTTPDQVLAHPDAWPMPLIAKPIGGSSSIGVAVVRSLEQLEVATAAGGYIVQTLAPGREVTVDTFVDRQGRALCAVPRRRLEVRHGEISKGVTVRHAGLEDLAKRTCEALPGAYGVLNVQIFWDPATDAMNIIEVNPRFGGGYPLAHEAGARYADWLVAQVAGLPLPDDPAVWRDGLVMLRYDAAVFVDRQGAALAPGDEWR